MTDHDGPARLMRNPAMPPVDFASRWYVLGMASGKPPDTRGAVEDEPDADASPEETWP